MTIYVTMIIIVCTHLTKCQSRFGYVVFVNAFKITSTWMLVYVIVITYMYHWENKLSNLDLIVNVMLKMMSPIQLYSCRSKMQVVIQGNWTLISLRGNHILHQPTCDKSYQHIITTISTWSILHMKTLKCFGACVRAFIVQINKIK